MKKGSEDLLFTDREHLIEGIKDKPDLVILASENRVNPESEEVLHWLTENEAVILTDYVKEGGSWLAWHAGLASYEDVPSYIEMIGGYFTHHPAEHAVVSYRYKDHDLVKEEYGTFEVTDEHYFIKHEEGLDIFLESFSIDGEAIAGWTKEFGQGRVAGYAPSHTKEGLAHQALRSDLRMLIDWCLNEAE